MRMDEPRMPALLYTHGRPGFYLRVLEEGEVGAGDAIERVALGPEAMTVREISALLYLPGHTRRLLRALAIPALSQGWRRSFAALLEQTRGRGGNLASPPGGGPPAWPGLRPFRVAEVVRESRSIASFVLEPVDGEPLPAFPRPVPDGAGAAAGRAAPRCCAPSRSRRRPTRSATASASSARRRGSSARTSTTRSAGRRDRGRRAARDVHPRRRRARARRAAERGRRRDAGARDARGARRAPAAGARSGGSTGRAAAPSTRSPEARAARRCAARRPVARPLQPPGRPTRGPRLRRGRPDHSRRVELGVPRDADFYLCGPLPGCATSPPGCWAGASRTRAPPPEIFGSEPLEGAPAPSAARPAGDRPRGRVHRLGADGRAGIGLRQPARAGRGLRRPAGWSCRTGVCHRASAARRRRGGLPARSARRARPGTGAAALLAPAGAGHDRPLTHPSPSS